MKSQEIRQAFLDFFASKQHKIVPSAPIVIKDDPTLMFTNAGMNPFKEFFLGQKEIKDNKIADTQKCLRVSGKHNDLEEVGIDTYHHTMFEMLGNWSFGDYFKKEAIQWAWELLTEVYGIEKDNLYVTVFEGSKDADQLPLDQEAYDLWKEIIPEERIIMGNKKDNFWEMGAQGPCGPCSEIHVDIRSAEEKQEIPGKDLVNQDHPQVIEIWNLVFMQFNRKADGILENLPAKHVDTGMGFERLCMVLQGVTSNYDTDVFGPLIKKVTDLSGFEYGKKQETDIAIRVIVDHIRAVAFAIADGQLPSNNGAGYVIRRILRRAIRYGFTFLNKKEAFINELVTVLSNQLGKHFPELAKQEELITKVIKEEELSFLKTLGQGLGLLDDLIKQTQGKEISGEKAFELYDTYGFPKDLTALILQENNLSFDESAFEKALQAQKDRSRAAAQLDTDDWQILNDSESTFVGYDQTEATVRINRYRKVTSKKDGTLFQLVFDQTPFYPEGGGQVGDQGSIVGQDQQLIQILDTKKENNLIIHTTKKLPVQFEQSFDAKVNLSKRNATQKNHSATHLLHEALRTVLGTHVAQKGSLVNDQYLRFDFSHFSKVTADELTQIEKLVNQKIEASINLDEYREMPFDEAINKGAMALFGEKYGEKVRLICFGDSKELCGGTHVANTNEIWHFKIKSEGAVAAGIRRIEAITGDRVKNHYEDQENFINQIKNSLKNNQDVVKAIQQLQEENNKLKKQVESLTQLQINNTKEQIKKEAQNVNGVQFIQTMLDFDAAAIKNLAHDLGQEMNDLFFIAGSKNNGKALLTCYISKNLVDSKNLDAGKIVRELGKFIQGGGGGQKFFATAGGKKPEGLEEALQSALSYLK